MLSQKMQDQLNEQIKWELFSGYLYLSMAAYFSELGLMGFANWMKVQEQEERFHALKFYDFVAERGGRVILQTIDAPPSSWKSPLEALQVTLEHERMVTARINTLMDVALSDKDHATANFLQWYVAEQVEEEASVSDVVAKLKLVDGVGGAMFMLDKELATRVFTPPAAA